MASSVVARSLAIRAARVRMFALFKNISIQSSIACAERDKLSCPRGSAQPHPGPHDQVARNRTRGDRHVSNQIVSGLQVHAKATTPAPTRPKVCFDAPTTSNIFAAKRRLVGRLECMSQETQGLHPVVPSWTQFCGSDRTT